LKEWNNARVVAVYLALSDEPSLDPLITAGKDAGKIMAVPKYGKDGMHFVQLITPFDQLSGLVFFKKIFDFSPKCQFLIKIFDKNFNFLPK